MISLKNRILGTGLKTLYHSNGYRILAPFTQGVGMIFMLHQVRPKNEKLFDPNGILSITPEFLELVIEKVLSSGIEIVSIDEAYERLKGNNFTKRFVIFTLDDGYRDNREYAYPVFKKFQCPFTVYVPGSFPDGQGELWWLALQEIIENSNGFELTFGDRSTPYNCRTDVEKEQVFNDIYWWMRSLDEDDQREFIRRFASENNFSLSEQCRRLIMTWDELRQLANDPLVTIAAHTQNHLAIAKLSAHRARQEIELGLERIEQEIGKKVEHFSFPYGDNASAGPREFRLCSEFELKTAVTTRKGVLYPEHKNHLTALPRVSLNGDFQSEEFISLYLTGAPFALWNRFRKINVA